MGKRIFKASMKYDENIGSEKTKELLADELSKFLVDSEFINNKKEEDQEGNLIQSIELVVYDEIEEEVKECEQEQEQEQKTVKNVNADKINETLTELNFITEIFKENQMKMINYYNFAKEDNKEIFEIVEKQKELELINEEISQEYYIKICNMFRDILEIDNKLVINIDGDDVVVNVINEKADGTIKYVKPLYLDKEKGEVILKEMDF